MLTDLGPVQTPPRCLTQVMRRPKSPHPDPRRITASPDGTRCAVPLVRFCVVAFARSRVNARRRQRGRALHRSQRRWTAKARCQVSCTQLARHTLATVTFSAPGTRAPVSQFQRREAAPRAHSPSRVESRSHRHVYCNPCRSQRIIDAAVGAPAISRLLGALRTVSASLTRRRACLPISQLAL